MLKDYGIAEPFIIYITVEFIGKAIIAVVWFNKSALMLKTGNWITSEGDIYCYPFTFTFTFIRRIINNLLKTYHPLYYYK